MKMHKSKPYPGFPRNWTIVRQGGEIADYFYAYNFVTGEKGKLQWTYDDAFNDMKRRAV